MKLLNATFKMPKLRNLYPFKHPSRQRSEATLSQPSVRPSAPAQSSQSEPAQPTRTKAASPQERSAREPNTTAVDFVIAKLPFKESKGSRLALNLLLVRPWVLVLGFWLVSALGATMALEGMLRPRHLTMDSPKPAAEATADQQKDSFIIIEQRSDDIVGGVTANDATADASVTEQVGGPVSAANTAANSAVEPIDKSSQLPIWPLAALVGSCATGCLVISRRRAMVRMAAMRTRGKVRKVRPVDKAAGKVASPIANSKVIQRAAKAKAARGKARSVKGQPALAVNASGSAASPVAKLSARPSAAGTGRPKRRRQRNRRVTASAPKPATGGSRVLASRAIAQQAVSSVKPTRPRYRRSPHRHASRQPAIGVVPASESHALDWSNGSLAHQLDVRPHRSAI